LSENHIFDLIFIKLIMPGVSGYETSKEIRAIEKNYELSEDDRHFICGFAADVNDCKINLILTLFVLEVKKQCKES